MCWHTESNITSRKKKRDSQEHSLFRRKEFEMNIKEFVEKMADDSAIAIPIEDGDYMGADGLMYCGKCHTPKQTRVQLFGSERTVNCLCECGVKKRDKEKENECREKRSTQK